uniref:Phosphorylase b kinase regulatory subunit n=1 Tax=Ditylenchus dipsaci TaxID=166011 RepID=A0A915EIU8_9BILA
MDLCKDKLHVGFQITIAQMMGKVLTDVDVPEVLVEKIKLRAYNAIYLAIWKMRVCNPQPQGVFKSFAPADCRIGKVGGGSLPFSSQQGYRYAKSLFGPLQALLLAEPALVIRRQILEVILNMVPVKSMNK